MRRSPSLGPLPRPRLEARSESAAARKFSRVSCPEARRIAEDTWAFSVGLRRDKASSQSLSSAGNFRGRAGATKSESLVLPGSCCPI